MKHSIKQLIVIVIILMTAAAGFAIDIRGDLSTETRFAIEDGDLLFNQENGSLTFDNQVNDNIYAKLVLDFCYYNNPAGQDSFSTILDPIELGMVYAVYPFEIGIGQAYFTYSDFILAGIDLSVGKQRINWGTADKFNPTDILNPLDLKDPFSFGEKIPSLAVNLVWNFSMFDSYLQLVYEPYSSIARLNPGIVSTMQAGLDAAYVGICMAGGLNYTADPTWNSPVAETPEANLKSFVVGAKLAGSLFGFDLSANYVTRMNDMPYVKSIDINANGSLDVTSHTYTLGYYREHEVGFDVAKDLGIFLSWAEVAVFFQDKIETAITTTVAGFPTTQYSEVLPAEPYVKYTLGLSQKFAGFIYCNFQFNHGFFNQRGNEGAERLQDYFVLRTEFSTLSDKLVFGLTGLGNINNVYDAVADSDMIQYITDNSGYMVGIDITYQPVMGMSMKAGFMYLDGQATSSIGSMKDYDMVTIAFDFTY